MLRTGLGMLAVFVTWAILDFILHGMILTSTYMATAQLWRPMPEIKFYLSYVVTLIAAVCFVFVYAQWIADKRMQTALLYGLVAGIAHGATMGYGSYAVMPIPYLMALCWFLGMVVEGVAGGLVMALIVKPEAGGKKR